MSLDAISSAQPLSTLQGIRPTEGLSLPLPGTLGISETSASGKTFGQYLESAIGEVNSAQLHSADMTKRFAAGEPMDVHQVMVASQEAGVMLDLAVTVRNKLVDAYQEIMRVSM